MFFVQNKYALHSEFNITTKYLNIIIVSYLNKNRFMR